MYSQKNEEAVILQAVGDRIGRFLDIGSYDGVTYSNTMALVERGWEGVMVEPGLEAFQKLLKNHGGNPKLQLVHAAVSPFGSAGLTQFWNNPATFSTTNEHNRDRFIHEGFAPPFWVASVTIQEVLAAVPGEMNVLSIDTEGTSVDLLFAYPFEIGLYRPWVVCVEHDAWSNCVWDMPRLLSIIEFMTGHGYKLEHSNEENVIFVEAL